MKVRFAWSRDEWDVVPSSKANTGAWGLTTGGYAYRTQGPILRGGLQTVLPDVNGSTGRQSTRDTGEPWWSGLRLFPAPHPQGLTQCLIPALQRAPGPGSRALWSQLGAAPAHLAPQHWPPSLSKKPQVHCTAVESTLGLMRWGL